MKSLIIFILLSFFFCRLQAQNVVNPSFDSVFIGGIDRIYAWITSDSWSTTSGDTVSPLNPSDHYVSTSLQYHETFKTVQLDYGVVFDGTSAIKVLSYDSLVKEDGSAFRGFVVNGNHFYTDSTGYIDLSKCGTPFPYRPYLLRGHYKFEDHSPILSNYPKAVVLLKKYNLSTLSSDTIGFSEISAPLVTTGTWSSFEMVINYRSNLVPDSIVVAFLSSGVAFNSTFSVDSLGFSYSFPASIDEAESLKIFSQDYSGKKIHFFNSNLISSVSIFSVNGQLILKEETPTDLLDVSILPKGNYVMALKFSGEKTTSFKISF